MLLETERGSTRSDAVENSLWKRLWACHCVTMRDEYMHSSENFGYVAGSSVAVQVLPDVTCHRKSTRRDIKIL
jgi:hypothetical protein